MSKRDRAPSENSDNKRPCHETKINDLADLDGDCEPENNGPFYWEMPGTIASGRSKGQEKPAE